MEVSGELRSEKAAAMEAGEGYPFSLFGSPAEGGEVTVAALEVGQIDGCGGGSSH